MTNGSVRTERNGPVATLWFETPPNGCMDPAMESGLLAAVEAAEADEAVRAVVLTGAREGVFIRHYDVGELVERGRTLASRGLVFTPERPVPEAPIHKAQRLMEESGKAYLAAMNGTAMGGGFEIALACDLRVAAEGPHRFGLPEINLGLLPGAGGTQRLTRVLGRGRALEVMLLGETFSPTELIALGLARPASADGALATARRLAARLAAKPPRALAHIKRLVGAAAQGETADGFAAERTLFCDLMVRDDALALMSAVASGARTIEDEPSPAQETET